MRRTLLVSAALLGMAAMAADRAGPPPTAVKPVRDVLSGVAVIDPYRWLEGSAAPEMAQPDLALDARVGAWTDAQNAYARSVLDNLPGRKELEARLRALTAKQMFRSAPTVRGRRLFFFQLESEQSQPVLMTSEGDGAARPLVDPNRRDPNGLTTIAWRTSGNGSRPARPSCGRSSWGRKPRAVCPTSTATPTRWWATPST